MRSIRALDAVYVATAEVLARRLEKVECWTHDERQSDGRDSGLPVWGAAGEQERHGRVK